MTVESIAGRRYDSTRNGQCDCQAACRNCPISQDTLDEIRELWMRWRRLRLYTERTYAERVYRQKESRHWTVRRRFGAWTNTICRRVRLLRSSMGRGFAGERFQSKIRKVGDRRPIRPVLPLCSRDENRRSAKTIEIKSEPYHCDRSDRSRADANSSLSSTIRAITAIRITSLPNGCCLRCRMSDLADGSSSLTSPGRWRCNSSQRRRT